MGGQTRTHMPMYTYTMHIHTDTHTHAHTQTAYIHHIHAPHTLTHLQIVIIKKTVKQQEG